MVVVLHYLKKIKQLKQVYIMGYHSLLISSNDFIEAMQQAYILTDNIT